MQKFYIYERRVNPDRRKTPRRYLDGRPSDRRRSPTRPFLVMGISASSLWVPIRYTEIN